VKAALSGHGSLLLNPHRVNSFMSINTHHAQGLKGCNSLFDFVAEKVGRRR
jgi:hypothetical protein